MRQALSLLVVCISLGTACKRPNPEYCSANEDCSDGETCNVPTHTCVAPGEPDAGASCSSDEECSADAPVCGVDGTCRTCALDDECASGVCAADGSCEPSERVLYVTPTGLSAGQCDALAPCDLYYAKSLVTAERFTIRLANGTYLLNGDFIVSGAVSKLVIVGGRSAALQRAVAGPALDVQAAELTLRGVTLNKGVRCSNATMTVSRVLFDNPPSEVRPWIDALGCTLDVSDSELYESTGVGIAAQGKLTIVGTRIETSASHGVEANSSNNVSIQRSIIARNLGLGITAQGTNLAVDASLITYNRGGGIRSTFGSFDITNNVITFNGDPGASGFGGLHLDSSDANNRLQHNTITHNDCDVNYMPVLAGGVYCIGASAPNNLIANNFRGNTMLANAQTGGTCNFASSIISETDATLGFAADGFHLLETSPAVGAGIASNVSSDFDGELRSDGAPDVGADELHP